MNPPTNGDAPGAGVGAGALGRFPRGHWAVLVAAVCVAYANSFSGVFVMDDLPAIVTNPTLRSLSWEALQPPSGGGLTVEARPVLNLSLALNYAMSSTDPWSYHATNLAIHLLATLTLLGLLRRLLACVGYPYGREAAFMVALLWGLHPLQTESVTYVVQRTESLMGLFYLGTLYCQVRGIGSAAPSSRWWLAAAVALCGLGMGTKEVMVSAPLLALLIDRTLLAGSFAEAWRQRRWFYVALFSTWLILLGLQIGHLDRGGTIGAAAGMTWWHYACCQARAILHYVRLSVWPFPLVFDYGSDFVDFAQIWVHGIVDLGLLALTFFALWRRSALGLVGAWFFFILAPTSSVVGGSRQMLAEHRMYLPLAAIIVLLMVGAYRVLGPRAARWASAAVAGGLLVATIDRNADYRSDLALYEDNFRKRPGEAHSIYNYGYALQQQGRTDEAIVLYKAALAAKPDFSTAYDDLANLLASLPGREEEAVGYFEVYLRLHPQFSKVHNNLGVLLVRMPGRLDDGIRHLERALKLSPDFPEAHLNLAEALIRQPERAGEALAHYEAAVRLKPDYAEAHHRIGVFLAGVPGRETDAIAHLRAGVRLKPQNAEGHVDLGSLIARQSGRAADGIPHFETAIRLRPDFAAAHFNLAYALGGLPERAPDAVAHYEEAVRLRPDYAEARNALAVLLAAMPGRQADAMAQLQAAVQAKPDYAEAHNNLGLLLVQVAGRPAEALVHFEAALAANPKFADAHFSMGMTLRMLGRSRDAAQHFAAALKLRPDFPEARAELDRLQQ